MWVTPGIKLKDEILLFYLSLILKCVVERIFFGMQDKCAVIYIYIYIYIEKCSAGST